MPLPSKVFGLAAVVAFALLIVLLGCIAEDNWWSLFTVVCYLVACMTWMLFQPGVPSSLARAPRLRVLRVGLAGGAPALWLFKTWGDLACRFYLPAG